jgi:excisionase family DNA binding protein
MPEMLTLKEVAAMLKVTIPTLYNLRKRGLLQFVKIGRLTRIEKECLLHYLAGQGAAFED